MKRKFSNWKTEIAIALKVQQHVQYADRKGLWDYQLPRGPATNEELTNAETILGHPLDAKYRTFLSHANGWPDFYQRVDLFGTMELCGCPLMIRAMDMLQVIVDPVWDDLGLTRESVLPIAKSKNDLDMFVIVRPSHGHRSGQVVWLAGSCIDLFPDFDEFFLSMIDYNRLTLEEFKKELAEE